MLNFHQTSKRMLLETLTIPATLLVLFILILSFALFHPNQHLKDDRKHPPGPKPLPIIGNLHMLGKLPHRTLQALAKKHGPIMSIKLGQIPAIVVSSPETAELFLKTHDVVFASRPKTQAAEYLSYGGKGMVFTEYGPYWRHVRKLCTTQLLSASKVEMLGPLRREELGVFVKSVEKVAASGDVVNLSEQIGELMSNIVCKMILGCSKDDRFDLKGLTRQVLHLVGVFNVADYVPWAAIFDLQVQHSTIILV